MSDGEDRTYRTCHGCGARFERTPWALDEDLRASSECWHACGVVSGFGLKHQAELGELHQLVVDTYGVQHAGEPTRPIRADAVRRWSAAVWAVWAERHDDVAALTERLFPGRFTRRPQ